MVSPVNSDSTFLNSTFYEQLVEHVFITEVLQEVWYSFGKMAEVLRSEIDTSGYDVVIECNSILRHIQLKSSSSDAKASFQKVNIALGEKPSGCVIWLFREQNSDTRRMLLAYRFFGSGPGRRLPSLQEFKTAKHTKGNAIGKKTERKNIRKVPKSKFITIPTTKALVELLFGL